MNTSVVILIAITAWASCAAPREAQPTPSDEVTGVELILTPDNCVSTEPNVRVTVSEIYVPDNRSFYVDNFKLYQDDQVRAELCEDGMGGLIASLGPRHGGFAWMEIEIHLRREGDRILVTPHMTFPNDLDDDDVPSEIVPLRGSIQLAAGAWKVGGPVVLDVNLVGSDDTVFLARGEVRGGVPDSETRAQNRNTAP